MAGKGRGEPGPSTAGRAANQAVSLREESSGRTRVDEATLLRVNHLQRLATWAGPDAGVGPLGALLGRRLAASAEAAAVPLGAATFLCHRCETVLKPGFNCTVRIKNKRNKTKRRKKSNHCQNSVSYACHLCGDQNPILGSGKGIVKSLLSSRQQANLDSRSRILRRNKSNTRTQDMKEVCEHSQAAVLILDSSSRMRQLPSERLEQGERLRLLTDCKTEERATSSTVESGHIEVTSFEEGSIQKLVLGNETDEHMHEAEPISSKKINLCEAYVTPKAEFMVGSKFFTPQKNKLMDTAEPFDTRSTRNKKRETFISVTGKTPASSSKSAPNDSRKNNKSAMTDATQVSGSSRKRARKGWTTLKQIAEKDELERKEKMGNFVIPFFMQ